MPTVGLVVNPSAGRDIRRIAGAATVSDNYGKKQIARAVLEGVASVEGCAAIAVPDKAGLGQTAAADAPDGLEAAVLEGPRTAAARETQAAVDRLAEEADVIVVLGGDGTTRDVALGLDGRPTPVVAISTGTNNVVPSHVDGTAAGIAAGCLAADLVPSEAGVCEHGMVEAAIEDDGADATDRRLRGLATLGVLEVPFVGTRAVLHGRDLVGGVVSRAHPADIGLSGVAGVAGVHAPDAPGGVGLRLVPAADAPRTVRAITVPGVVETLGLETRRTLADGEAMGVHVTDGTLSVDGERELELQDAHVAVRPVAEGPRIVDVETVLAAAAERDVFVAAGGGE